MKKLHLAWFGGGGPGGWQSPGLGYDYRRPDVYRDYARACERAKLDLILFADTSAIPNMYAGHLADNVRKGKNAVALDPVPLITVMASATKHIGVGATLSTTFYPPFLLARLLASLDHLTGGRVLWNVVTSTFGAENFGLDELPPHDERYDIADEYIALCRGLWDSWEPGAVVLDPETKTFAEPAKVHEVNFEGKYFRSRGPLNVDSSPQRYPVICMAGASPRGQRFCAEHADMAIAHKNTVEDMREYSDDIHKALSNAGRDPSTCKIFFSIKPIIGDSEAMAQEKLEYLRERADIGEGLAYLSQTLGIDITKYELDEPLPGDIEITGIQGKLMQYYSQGRNPTVREMALHEAMNETFEICGTPAHIADVLEDAASRGGADGFHVRAGFSDYGYGIEFLSKVVPELQRRGMFRQEYSGVTLKEHLFEY